MSLPAGLPLDLVVTARVHPGGERVTVAIRGDRIVAVVPGAAGELGLIGSGTRIIDAPDLVLLPGFQDAHVHAPVAGRNRLQLDLSDRFGRDEYLAVIADYAAKTASAPPATASERWILGGGWALECFPASGPTRQELDAIVPDRPVFLFNRDVHGAWVNSRALELAGIDMTGVDASTPDPPDGRFERDESGRPTGMLHEGAAYAFNEHVVPQPAQDELQAAILNAQEHLLSLGVTGWQDAWVTRETAQAYHSLAADGRLVARVVGALWWDRHRGLEQIDELVEMRERYSRGSGAFHPRSVKIMLDGVLENQTGAMLDPYLNPGEGAHESHSGSLFIDPELLAEAVVRLDRLDFQVHLHTIGDRAVRVGLDAVEAALKANGQRGNRHHLAHIQVVHPDDVPRFAALGVVANCQAYWAQNEPQLTELTAPFLGEHRMRMMYPFGDLARNGTALAMGSDWPVSTPNPLEQIEVAVHRRLRNPEEGGSFLPAPFLPEQALTLEQAVLAFTRGSAFVNHDDDAGVIAVGKRADLVLIAGDMSEIVTTIVGGQVVGGQVVGGDY